MSRATVALRVALLVCALLLTAWARPARACANATLADDGIVVLLKGAEDALEEGDVAEARARSGQALAEIGGTTATSATARRATRLLAMSTVRDRDASPEALARAALDLEDLRRFEGERTPDREALYGEALARLPERTEDARAILAPLAARDLLGSAFAYAALARLEREEGHEARASAALARCAAMARDARICRGEYPRPPLLRGAPAGYALPGLVFLGALGLRRVRARRARRAGLDASGRPLASPWLGWRAWSHGAVLVLAGVLAVLLARTPAASALAAAAACAAVAIAERRGFLRAVRRGAVDGVVLRPAAATDPPLPEVRLFFGPAAPEVLEHQADPAYREPARAPALRITRRSARGPALAAAAALLLAAFASSFFLFLSASARSAPEAIPAAAPAAAEPAAAEPASASLPETEDTSKAR